MLSHAILEPCFKHPESKLEKKKTRRKIELERVGAYCRDVRVQILI